MTKPLSPKTLLSRYRDKRNFDTTSEPSGDRPASKSVNTYLIQKHAARRLHFDFRLELDGVLKSWAVTRGPSLNPADKRLAVHVEDHPLDYGSFEGTIPAGEYGGGTVMLWDNGNWEPVGDPHRGYTKGHLTFLLHGQRLKGQWHLVRMHGRAKSGKHENWLLIKGHDEYANEKNGDYAIERYQSSVTTDRGMPAIAAGTKAKPVKKSKAVIKTKAIPGKPVISAKHAAPHFIAPQLATLVTTPPTGPEWLHEIKFDGYRLLASINDSSVTLTTRADNDWTAKFAGLAKTLAKLDVRNALIDGEAVSMAEDGTMSFHGLQHALKTGDAASLNYYAFDLLFLNGEDLRSRPLRERKAALQELLAGAPPNIHYSEHFSDTGEKVLHHACSLSLEGIVSKRANAAYYSGRDMLWLKSKCTLEQEVVIGGYTLQPKHPGTLAAILTGYYDKKDFIFAGKAGTGFTREEGGALLKKLRALECAKSPYKSLPAAMRSGAHWVKPELVAQIHFAEWTPDGMMRHPSYQGLREDKPASEVVREKEKPIAAAVSPAPARGTKGKLEIAGVSITHPDRLLYPADRLTKQDLAEYYLRVAPLMLPHVAGRPISLLRCPEGAGKQCFFQRHGSATVSPFVKPVHIPGKGKDEPYLMIEDERGLLALVQMGVLEIHCWGSMADDIQLPDRLTFDLDPAPEVAWATVKKAAIEIRDRLKVLNLTSFLKTTGGKGLHIVVPIVPGPDWNIVKSFTRDFCNIMVEAAPKHFTTNNRKDARIGKIFLDYLRNGEGASAVAPYSTRARAGAPIAAPLDWSKLTGLKSGHETTVKNSALRFHDDPWRDIFKIRQRLPR